MNQPPSADTLLRAFLSRPVDPPLGLRAGDALYREGHEAAAVAVWSLADDVDPRMRQLAEAEGLPTEVREASTRADTAFRRHFTRLHRQAIDTLQAKTESDLARVRNGIWPRTHDAPFEWGTPLQRPVIFYMPDLPTQSVTANAALPWSRDLASAWQEIRREYLTAIEESIPTTPYVPAGTRDPRWSRLRGTRDWSSIHLFREGERTPEAGHFPATLAALEKADLVRVDGVPMEAFFSRLRPGAHIPPHFGLTNTRLTVHLPLIVPEDCAIRVGRDVHHWTEGEITAFDDSFEHEAWNRAGSDRVVLIFEAHHPDLSVAERGAIEHAYSARHRWLGERRRLLEHFLATH